MPTLFRFLLIVGLLAGSVYAGLVALATFVEPEKREMRVIIPPANFAK